MSRLALIGAGARALVLALPLWIRKFGVDAIETGAAALVVLGAPLFNGAPLDRDAFAHAVVAALLGALISAGRREAPDAIAWGAAQWSAVRAWLGVD